jgi:hypothetical protein
MTGSPAAFARSVARWLRAYPRRWRTARADEITALLADLAPDGARRLGLRPGLGLLRGGWATRWREHPPFLPWLGYAVLGRRLPPRYRSWAEDDIDGPWPLVRRFLLTTVPALLVVQVALFGGGSVSREFLTVFVPLLLVGTALHAPGARDKRVAGHLALRPGEVVAPGARIHALVPRARVAAAPALRVGTVVTAAALLLGTVTVAVDPSRRATLLVVLAATAIGVAGALITTSRLRRWEPAAQPGRVVVPFDAHSRSRVVAATLGATALLAANPDLAGAAALPLALGAALLLPVLVAARRAVSTGRTHAVAAIDVRRAILGRPDRADRRVAGFLPATAWLPLGVVAPPLELEGPPGDVAATGAPDAAGGAGRP